MSDWKRSQIIACWAAILSAKGHLLGVEQCYAVVCNPLLHTWHERCAPSYVRPITVGTVFVATLCPSCCHSGFNKLKTWHLHSDLKTWRWKAALGLPDYDDIIPNPTFSSHIWMKAIILPSQLAIVKSLHTHNADSGSKRSHVSWQCYQTSHT